ncbi:MAG TPA: DUF1801 domain-containing protein [Paludibacter sp.]|nr:DUF1801 domain-containing protein [Paludibacter sp.]
MAEKKEKTTAKTIDEYIALQPDIYKEPLNELNHLIKSVAPEATESISYGVACYNYHYMLVGFSCSKNHYSFLAMSSTVFDKFRDELNGYDTATGTIRFKPGQTIPANLITRIILERKAENETRAKAKKKK